MYPTSSSKYDTNFKEELIGALIDDLNISKALSVIDEMINSANEKLDKDPKNKALKREILANIKLISKVLGIGKKESFEYFQLGVSQEKREEIEALIKKRDKAKRDKDYQLADAIRDELNRLDIMIMDTADGTKWERKF